MLTTESVVGELPLDPSRLPRLPPGIVPSAAPPPTSKPAAAPVKPGDKVAIMLPNCPQYPIAFFAAMRLGAIVVNINPSYTPYELAHVAADSGLRFLVTRHPSSLPLDLEILPETFEALIAAGDPLIHRRPLPNGKSQNPLTTPRCAV